MCLKVIQAPVALSDGTKKI